MQTKEMASSTIPATEQVGAGGHYPSNHIDQTLGSNMGIISSIKKNLKLNKLMKRIGSHSNSIEDMAAELTARLASTGPSDSEIAEQELFDLVCTDPDTSKIMEHFHASREDIIEYYSRLKGMGLGRWVRESYVAAAAIALKPTLIYLLQCNKNPLPEGWDDKDLWIQITADLVDYFESGSMGPVRQE